MALETTKLFVPGSPSFSLSPSFRPPRWSGHAAESNFLPCSWYPALDSGWFSRWLQWLLAGSRLGFPSPHCGLSACVLRTPKDIDHGTVHRWTAQPPVGLCLHSVLDNYGLVWREMQFPMPVLKEEDRGISGVRLSGDIPEAAAEERQGAASSTNTRCMLPQLPHNSLLGRRRLQDWKGQSTRPSLKDTDLISSSVTSLIGK